MDWLSVNFFTPFRDIGWLASLVEFITILAEDTIIIVVGALLYWCVDAKKGQRMALSAIGGVFWTLGTKNFLRVPRPWDLGFIDKSDVIRAETATGYSFPSGHTTAGANIYGYFASVSKKTWCKLALWLLVALIGLSRIFLGCHTASDVLAAILVSVAWIYIAGFIFDTLLAKSEWALLLYAVPMLFAGLSLIRGFDEDVVKMLSFGGAVLVGIFLERRLVHYEVKGNIAERALAFAIGLVGLILLKLWPEFVGLGEVFWLKCVCYGVLALWVSLIYPALLKAFNNKAK